MADSLSDFGCDFTRVYCGFIQHFNLAKFLVYIRISRFNSEVDRSALVATHSTLGRFLCDLPFYSFAVSRWDPVIKAQIAILRVHHNVSLTTSTDLRQSS